MDFSSRFIIYSNNLELIWILTAYNTILLNHILMYSIISYFILAKCCIIIRKKIVTNA